MQFERTENLIGKEKLDILKTKKVIVFGVGGVGSYVVEALVRSGISYITVVDNDVVSLSNINRQLIALNSTIGKPKVEVIKQRILDIFIYISFFNIPFLSPNSSVKNNAICEIATLINNLSKTNLL